MTFWIELPCLCVLLAGVETLHGVARTLLIAPRIGRERAQRWSVVSGTLLAFAVCWLAVPGLEARGSLSLLLIGAALSLFMAAFDVVLSRIIAKKDWAAIAAEFDPSKGNYLLFGLLLLATFPYLVMRLRP